MRTQALSALLLASSLTLAAAGVRWEDVLDQPREWYGTSEARAIADAVRLWQRPDGGWPKNVDMTVAPVSVAALESTIDNRATVTQIRLLGRVFVATARPVDREAATAGVDYLLGAQYPNGGWPQVYPLRQDYSRRITFNDDAMTGVLALLEEVSNAETLPFLDDSRRRRARAAIESAETLILRTQIQVGGRLTVWCAQHDEVSLEPRPARAYEHVSLSGRESVGIVRFLMRRPPRAEVIAAVDAAVTWLRQARLPDGRWARFYEIGTNRPIFSGRDGIVRYDMSEIEEERRTGYAWLGDWPRRLLDTEYPRWRDRLTASRAR